MSAVVYNSVALGNVAFSVRLPFSLTPYFAIRVSVLASPSTLENYSLLFSI